MSLTADADFPRDRSALLREHFADLNDDRESWRVAYPIKEVLFLVTCATPTHRDARARRGERERQLPSRSQKQAVAREREGVHWVDFQ